jgi:hypothetical protein
LLRFNENKIIYGKICIKADKICIIRLPPGSTAAEGHCMSRQVVAPAVSRGKPK